MKKLSMAELKRLNIKEFRDSEKNPVIIILDNIRSLYNIGSIFRTSDAFRIETLYLCGITGTPPHREIHKAALGSTESVNWKYAENCLDVISELKKKNHKIFAVEQTDNSVFLNDFIFNPEEKCVYVFGNEINGVSDEILSECDACIEIPQFGTKHSFNVAVSAGIVLWQDYLKRAVNKTA